MRRYIQTPVQKDLTKKMVFIGGSRQVGKTTLAKSLMRPGGSYLNWDDDQLRTKILDKQFPRSGVIVFDELHKFRKWRNYLKGLYDTKARNLQVLVTGSARLDLYRFGGDSLQGRYHYWRLHPFSFAELPKASQNDLEQLFNLGGFPEPFLSNSKQQARRWSREYRARIIRDEVNSLERVSDLASMEILMGHLPLTVGSPLSVNSLREQLQVSHGTVSNWLHILERLYAFFRIPPFGPPKIRAVKKEQKAYLFDWSVVADEGSRFENLVACHLLKYVHFRQDSLGEDIDLRYYRDTTPREVDFVITFNNHPIKAIECKLSEHSVSPHLRYFKSKFPECECFQLNLKSTKDYLDPTGIRVMPARKLLQELS